MKVAASLCFCLVTVKSNFMSTRRMLMARLFLPVGYRLSPDVPSEYVPVNVLWHSQRLRGFFRSIGAVIHCVSAKLDPLLFRHIFALTATNCLFSLT